MFVVTLLIIARDEIRASQMRLVVIVRHIVVACASSAWKVFTEGIES